MTTLDRYVQYDEAVPMSAIPADALHTVEGMRRRREAIEARRPRAVPKYMLPLDRLAFLGEYRRRYGISPNAREWMAWYDHDKRRMEQIL